MGLERQRFLPAPHEPNRRAFVKIFTLADEWESTEWILPHLDNLERAGVVAETVALRRGRKYMYVYMKRVNGYELAKLPKRLGEFKMSVGFAQGVAILFQDFYNAGYYHDDPHSSNIMYDVLRDKFVAVDVDSITPNDGEIPLSEYVRDFSFLMLGVYLGFHPIDQMSELLGSDELEHFMPTTWPDFVKNDPKAKMEKYVPGFENLLERFSREPVLLFLERAGLAGKTNPLVLDFILRGINRESCPENFDEILRLKASNPN